MNREAARKIRETSGPTVLTMGAVADGEVLARSGSGVAGRTATSIVDAGLTIPKRPEFTGKLVFWSAAISAAFGTSALQGVSVHYVWHPEDQPTTTYDAIVFEIANSVAGAACLVGLYAPGSDGRPASLLWTSASIDVSTLGVFTKTFASDGTWQAAGASYKDGSNRLVLRRGQAIYAAWARNNTGAPSSRSLPISSSKPLGIRADLTAPYVAYREIFTYASGLPATPSALTELSGGSIPVLALRSL